jgi:hypothetical protein
VGEKKKPGSTKAKPSDEKDDVFYFLVVKMLVK